MMGIFSSYLMSKNTGKPKKNPPVPPTPRPKLSHDFGLESKQIINTNEIRKVVFKKGDILVLRIPRAISNISLDKTVEYLERVLDKVGLKDEVGIIILQDGFELYSVLTQNRDDCGHKEAKKPIGVDEYLERNKIL